MSSPEAQADYLVDRRKLRRKIRFWRVLAFTVAAMAIVAVGLRFSGGKLANGGAHIARVPITGLIVGDEETLKLIRSAGEAKNARALILAIDSPGGTTLGSERVYDEIRRVAAKKPVVAVVGTMAASGAYISALGSDRIIASGNSLVGSIGVIIQFPNVSRLLETVGVRIEEVKSSPLKASPNGYEPTSDAARAALNVLVQDSYGWFKTLVQDRRHLSDAELAAVSDGRVYTGRLGLPLKLVDQLGDEKDAISWLEKEKGIAASLPVTTYKRGEGFGHLGLFSAAANLAEFCGLRGFANVLRQQQGINDINALDGLLSIWHS